MHVISPDMVLDKPAIDADGAPLGEVVDVGLFDHSRVKFLVVQDRDKEIPIRRFPVDDIEGVSADYVTLRIMSGG
jgi:hypothetical protein